MDLASSCPDHFSRSFTYISRTAFAWRCRTAAAVDVAAAADAAEDSATEIATAAGGGAAPGLAAAIVTAAATEAATAVAGAVHHHTGKSILWFISTSHASVLLRAISTT